MPGTEPGTLSTKLNRLSEIAKQNPRLKFTSLAHLLDAECLLQAYKELNPQATAGIDKATYKEYGKNLTRNIQELIQRLKDKKYKATDIRRAWIPKPKPEGDKRPLGIAILEDKIVQRATTKILNAIYEQDFLDCSQPYRQMA